MFRKLKSRRRARRTQQPKSYRTIALEPLEQRMLLTTTLDLTTAGDSGFVGEAYFEQINPSSTGTGVIKPFLRLQDTNAGDRVRDGDQEGYNTDLRPVTLDQKSDPNFTRLIKLKEIPKVSFNFDGGKPEKYFQFLLDINESKPGTYLTLDQMQLFVDPAGDVVSLPDLQTRTKVFDLDDPALGGATDSRVVLNYQLNHGSGTGDMFANVPVSLFDDVSGNPYVYLYSRFGEDQSATLDDGSVVDTDADAGFEEWSLLKGGMNGRTRFDINGQKFTDVSGDGDITGDPGLNGWEISLYQETNDIAGFQIGDDAFIDSTVTANVDGVDGVYSFNDIDPVNKDGVQTFYVKETEDSTWTQTFGGNLDNDHYTVLLNSDLNFIDFGNFQDVIISGTKWEDHGGDGVRDAGDQGLLGWTILVDGNDVGVVTDANGDWSFSAGPGTYSFQEDLQGGWTQTFGNAGYTVTVGGAGVISGGTSTGNDFGNFKNFDISGYKWEDTDGDGDWDAGEIGLVNWTIELDDDGDGVADKTTTTNSSGYYEFTNLGPGSYGISEQMNAAWTNTYDGSTTVVAASGVSVAGTSGVAEPLNFGNFENIDISGVKFRDNNMNRQNDDGVYIGGFTIELYVESNGTEGLQLGEGGDTFVTSTVTADGTGVYEFTNLGPGIYYLQEIVPDGWIQTAPTDGIHTVVVGGEGQQSGENIGEKDFGNIELGEGGGHTLGYWSNKNGQATINALADGWNTAKAALADLWLRNEDGSVFDVAGSTYDQFRDWLLGGHATNMAYMLSVQAAAMQLNVLAGEAGLSDPGGVAFTTGDALIYAPGIGMPDAVLDPLGLGFITVDALLAEAQMILCDPIEMLLLLDGDEGRAYATLVKNALDDGNNNLIFLVE